MKAFTNETIIDKLSTLDEDGEGVRIAICEDESGAAEKLTETILDWADARKVEVDIKGYNNAESFLMTWPDVAFDLVFLDIEMKNISGIQLAEIIRETDKNMMIVFVTSHKQYALRGYDVNALHYLIKPLSTIKLLPVLDKAHAFWSTGQKEFLIVSNDIGKNKLLLNEIYYISMHAHNAEIYTFDNTHTLRKTANELAESLPSCFIRCHRSYIVNMYKVDCIYKDTLRLSNGTELPISRSSIKSVKDAFVRLHMR